MDYMIDKQAQSQVILSDSRRQAYSKVNLNAEVYKE